jgi:putative DNA primase/helicase
MAKSWHIWNGLRWQPDRSRLIYELMRQLVDRWWHAAVDDVTPDSTGNPEERMCALMTDAGWFKTGRGDFRKNVLPVFDTAKKESILKSLSARIGIAMDGDEWDPNPWQLGCPNSIIDLRDGSFTSGGEPDDLMTLSTGIEYDPAAPTPAVFLQNLAEITAHADGTPDPETASHMLMLLGYSLYGDKTEEVFAQWTGTGRNGKGKLKDILLHVVGDYGKSLLPGFYTKSKWGPDKASAARPDLLTIVGKRIAFESEPEGGDLNIELIKKHSGRDVEGARDLYAKMGEYHQFVPSHLTVLLTNNVLRVDKVDPALEDRLLVYPFDRRFEKDGIPPADPGRLDEMKAEATGILALLVQQCAAWYRSTHPEIGQVVLVLKGTMTERMKAATGKYLAANDPLRAAIEAYFVRESSAWESLAGLYSTYQEWHAAEDDPYVAGTMLSKAEFIKGLRMGLGLVEVRHHGGTRGFAGIRSLPFANRITDQVE